MIPLNQQERHGLHCPECNGFIPLTMDRLLSRQPLYCMDCGLKIEINIEKSAAALEALQKVKNAIDKAEEEIKKVQDPR